MVRVGGCDTSDASAEWFHHLRQPEVEHLHRAVGPDLDVRGLEIAMDDALLVRGFERVGDLPRDRQRFVDRASRHADSLRQIVAGCTSSMTSACDVVRLLESVNRSRCLDGSTRRACGLRARTGRARSGSAAKASRQDLDRDVAIRASYRGPGRPPPCRLRQSAPRSHTAPAPGRSGSPRRFHSPRPGYSGTRRHRHVPAATRSHGAMRHRPRTRRPETPHVRARRA